MIIYLTQWISDDKNITVKMRDRICEDINIIPKEISFTLEGTNDGY